MKKANQKSRRDFCKGMTAAALITTLHSTALEYSFSTGHQYKAEKVKEKPRILNLRLYTAADFGVLRYFYHHTLEMKVLYQKTNEITFLAGATQLTFVKAPAEMGHPWYHLAFNIPENKLLQARNWQLKRSKLIATPQRLVDPKYPNDVRHFRHWNAHSVFFWDPAGNLLEYIARHDLENRRDGSFTSEDILYISEIAFVVDDQPAAAQQLHHSLGLEVYPKHSRFWWAMGDELGLLLCIPKRLWGQNTEQTKKFEVFPTEAIIQGEKSQNFQLSNYPYQVKVET